MITEYIRYELTSHTGEELIAAYAAAGEHLKAAPECLGFELNRCEEAESIFILRIFWRSTADHLQGFRKGPNFPPFLELIRPFIGEMAEMRHYEMTDVVWTRG
jgi:heme-degrading monooxygenase HmoA